MEAVHNRPEQLKVDALWNTACSPHLHWHRAFKSPWSIQLHYSTISEFSWVPWRKGSTVSRPVQGLTPLFSGTGYCREGGAGGIGAPNLPFCLIPKPEPRVFMHTLVLGCAHCWEVTFSFHLLAHQVDFSIMLLFLSPVVFSALLIPGWPESLSWVKGLRPSHFEFSQYNFVFCLNQEDAYNLKCW